ncbi:MAG: PadR family transcriptional regulator [Gemmatimonadota bacterium]
MSRVNRTRYTILGCLTIEPMSGYDIKKFVDECVSHFWNESYGQIYPTLEKMEADGLIKGRRESGERGADRIVYRITAAGRKDLSDWLLEPAESQSPRDEYSLKLFFGHVVGPAGSIEHIARLRESSRAALDGLAAAEPELEASDAPWAPYRLAVLRGGLRYTEMVLEWCDATESDLRKLE